MMVILCQTEGRWPRNPERGEVAVTGNGVREPFPILTPVRAQVSVPLVQSLGKGPSSLRGPLTSSGRKEWGT
jgi:hypothetical protein